MSLFTRAVLTILTMLTVSPVVAVTTLVCWNPARWGGSLNPLAILGMAFFGLFTAPLWPTYLPAMAVTPLVMGKIAALPVFRRLPLAGLLALALLLGAGAGLGVISVIVPWHESRDLVLNWAASGAVSGGITLSVVSLIYRYEPPTVPTSGPV